MPRCQEPDAFPLPLPPRPPLVPRGSAGLPAAPPAQPVLFDLDVVLEPRHQEGWGGGEQSPAPQAPGVTMWCASAQAGGV